MLIPQDLIATPQTLNHSSITLNTTEPSSPASNFVEGNALFFLAYLLILYILSLWDYWIILRVRESCNRPINSKTTPSYMNYGSMDHDGSVPRTRNNSDALSDDSRSTLLPDSPPRQSSPLSEIQH